VLTAVRRSDGFKVLARASEKIEAPFACPRCRRELVLRKGRIKVHHFAHKPPVTCALGVGETDQHLRAKLAVFDALRQESNVTELELEKDFGTSVADVFARISGTLVAVEIQRSAVSVNDIVARTKNYHRLGVTVLWVGLPNADLSSQQYSPRAWEKWAHAAYFGRVYYWESGQAFRVVHFDPYLIHVPESTWYEDGSEQSAGGFDRTSRRWRTPRVGVPVLLSRGFQRIVRSSWSGGAVDVPECTLYIDRQAKWWRSA
jgi:competence protein CoiA